MGAHLETSGCQIRDVHMFLHQQQTKSQVGIFDKFSSTETASVNCNSRLRLELQ